VETVVVAFEGEKKLNELADKINESLPEQTAPKQTTTPQISM
jgi:hypothetical protein